MGPLQPSDLIIRSGGEGGMIGLYGDDLVRVAGLSLMGNIRLDSSQNTGAYSSVRLRLNSSEAAGSYSVSTYELSGCHSALFVAPGDSSSMSVAFGTEAGATGTPGTATRNYNNAWSNVQLVNSSVTPALASSTSSAAGSSAYWKDLGPSFGSIFSQFGKAVKPTGDNWTTYFVSSSGYTGFAGVFGNYNTLSNASANLRTTGLRLSLLAGSIIEGFGNDTNGTVFRKAGTGETPSVDSGVTDPGELGSFVDFDDLNVRVRTVKKGIDTLNVLTAYTDVTL